MQPTASDTRPIHAGHDESGRHDPPDPVATLRLSTTPQGIGTMTWLLFATPSRRDMGAWLMYDSRSR